MVLFVLILVLLFITWSIPPEIMSWYPARMVVVVGVLIGLMIHFKQNDED